MREILTTIATAVMMSTLAQGTFDELNYSTTGSTFKVHAPTDAKSVTLRLYDSNSATKATKKVKMTLNGDETWTATVDGDLTGLFYTFQVETRDKVKRAETPGVFAKAVGINGKRAAIVNLETTAPQGWAQDRRPKIKLPTDLVIYEMHHRDFSIHETSGIRHKGKFLALTEQSAIDYLVDLGINAVHILPSFDYASVDETRLNEPQYNWGYDPVNYNVPDGSYSTNPYDPATRIREFKEMVMALHKAGIRVILDVVYNHTFDIEGSNFQNTYPDYYFRKRDDGSYSDGSGCGNETASEQPLMRQFMIESVTYWINEYHIDGFRFDLMGIHDIETMNAIRRAVDSIDPTIYIYGEGWSAGSCAYPEAQLAMKANTKELTRIGAFCDDMRDALRGPFSDDSKGAFLAGESGNKESIMFGIAGAIAHPQIDMTKVNYSTAAWTRDPLQMVAYVSCHDDMCLTDRLRASIPGISEEELIRLDLLAQTAVLTSQGVPFILAGEELLRSKQGVHNSYKSPDSINALDYSNRHRYPQVFEYYKRLIHMRRAHPAFRMGTAERVLRNMRFLDTESDLVVAYHINGVMAADSWKDIIVILNAEKEAVTVTIPKGTYTIVCQDGVIDERGLGTIEGGTAEVPRQSALIIKR